MKKQDIRPVRNKYSIDFVENLLTYKNIIMWERHNVDHLLRVLLVPTNNTDSILSPICHSQPSVIAIPGNPIISPGFNRHPKCMRYTDNHASKTLKNKSKINLKHLF